MNKEDKALTVREVCIKLGIHKTTAYDLIHSGKLEAFTIGEQRGGYRVMESDLNKYTKKNKVKAWSKLSV